MGSSESSMFFLFCVAFGLLGCTVFWVILFKRGKGERREIRRREGRETRGEKESGEIVGPIDRTRPGYPSRISRVVPPSEVPLYNP